MGGQTADIARQVFCVCVSSPSAPLALHFPPATIISSLRFTSLHCLPACLPACLPYLPLLFDCGRRLFPYFYFFTPTMKHPS